jgi:hypothetical protein
LKLESLTKLEQEASAGEVPVFEIEFQGVFPHKRYVVLRDEDYQALKEC